MKALFLNNIYIQTIKDIYAILDKDQRKEARRMILSIIVSGLVDILGLAAILPVLYLALNRGVIYSNPALRYVYDLLGFTDSKHFLVFLALMLIVVFIAKNVIAALLSYYQARFSFKIGTELTAKQFKKYLNKDFLYFKNTNSNVIIVNITGVPMEFSQNLLLPTMVITTELLVLLLITMGIAFTILKFF